PGEQSPGFFSYKCVKGREKDEFTELSSFATDSDNSDKNFGD
ncbi:MAG: hypothetical protein JWQ51_2420, partial [Tardiphaga sp.]|nr:hypothetical protein [Tardiphaga sp.]